MASALTRRSTMAAAVAACLAVVGVLVVTGSREPAAALKLLTGQAWLANRATGTVSETNGYSGRVAAQDRVGAPGDPFTVVQRADGAYVLDTRTGRLSRVDGSSLAVAASRTLPSGTASAVQVVAGAATSWILDRSSGVLQQVDPQSLAPEGAQIALGGPTGAAVVDTAGNLWAPVPGRGRVAEVSPSGALRLTPLGRPGDVVTVTVTSAGTWAVDTTVDQARSLVDPTAPAVSLPPLPGGGAPLVGSSPTDPHLVVVAGSRLVSVDTATDTAAPLAQPTEPQASQVAVANTHAYLLDASADQVQAVSLDPLALDAPVPVPPGSDQLVAQDQLLFVNSDGGPQAVVINASGQVTPVTKYTAAPAVAATVPAAPSPSTLVPTPAPSGAPGPASAGSGPGGGSGPVLPVTAVATTPAPPAPTSAPPAPVAPAATPPLSTTTTTTAPGAPAVPGNVQASAGADGTLRVTWDQPADNGAPLTGYTILASQKGSGGANPRPAKVAAPPGSPQQVSGDITGLKDGQTWCAQVEAANSVGNGPLSPADQPAACATPVQGAPGAPGSPTAADTAAQTVTVSWTAATDPGTSVTRYIVSAAGVTPRTTTATSVAISGLSDATRYTFSVKAVNAAGTPGPAASAPEVETWGNPTTVSRVTVTPTANGTLSATWPASTSNEPGSAVSYAVTLSPGRTSTTAARSMTFPGLTYRTYTVTVQARTAHMVAPGTSGQGTPFVRVTVELCRSNTQGFLFESVDPACEATPTNNTSVVGSSGIALLTAGGPGSMPQQPSSVAMTRQYTTQSGYGSQFYALPGQSASPAQPAGAFAWVFTGGAHPTDSVRINQDLVRDSAGRRYYLLVGPSGPPAGLTVLQVIDSFWN